MRLDLALIRRHPTLSRRRARDVIEKGQVTVEGVIEREAGRTVTDTAQIEWDQNRKALPRARCSLPILFEDEQVLVIDKPAGLLSVPTPGATTEDTAVGRVTEYVKHKNPRRGFVGRVHRLDRDTSGALAFALSSVARAQLIDVFRAHRIERRYMALVVGTPRSEGGVIDLPLRDSYVGGRRAVAKPGEAAKPARTRYWVRERLAGASLLEVELGTGRQHQIRVHLAHMGHPVLGDRVYAGGGRSPVPVPRQMLHAWRLALPHPVTGEVTSVESPLPADFQEVLRLLRRRPSLPSGHRQGKR
jgi:23S rRNA pseudouridine1911/1915/1917 synthase